MKKRLAVLLSVALLGVGATASAAFADTQRVAQEDTGGDDGGTDYGWIGLLGLAGLAGLLGRKNDRDRDSTRTTTTQR